MGIDRPTPMDEAMADMAEQENRAEQAFWARLAKSGQEAVDTVKNIMALRDDNERADLIHQFNARKKQLEGPYTKDGIDCEDGFHIKVNRDNSGNIQLGFSASR